MTAENTPSPTPSLSLKTLTSEGGAARSAIRLMERQSSVIVGGLRRAIPFFARRGVLTKAERPRMALAEDLLSGLEAPLYLVDLASEPGGARATLALDGHAIAFLLEGSLGGNGDHIPRLDPKGLTSVQEAFVARIADNIVASLSAALEKSIGLKLIKLPKTSGDKRGASGSLIALPLVLSEPDDEEEEPPKISPRGKLLLALSKHALTTVRSLRKRRHKEIDQHVSKTLEQTEIELVAELGRIPIPLGKLSTLCVGDTLRLNVPVKGAIDIRAGNVVLFKGQPTTAGTQLAIRVTSVYQNRKTTSEHKTSTHS